MNTNKIAILLGVLCFVLIITNVAFILYFFNQSTHSSEEVIIIQKKDNSNITEEDINQAMTQAVNAIRGDIAANEMAYMAFMLTFIGTMATVTGISFTVYNFYQVSKVQEYVRQGIVTGITESKTKYEKYLMLLLKINEKISFILGEIEDVKGVDQLFYSLKYYYIEKNYDTSALFFQKFISANLNSKGYLNISLYKLYENAKILSEYTEEAYLAVTRCFESGCYVDYRQLLNYLDEEQRAKLYYMQGELDSRHMAIEKEMYLGACEKWNNLFEKTS